MDETDSGRQSPTPAPEPLGAVLAGGRGSRLGGAKPTVELAGRPLIAYPLAALAAAGIEAFVVAKPDTELPDPLAGAAGAERAELDVVTSGSTAERAELDVDLILEPAEPIHPLAGIVAALRHAARPVVVLGCDFPFASPALLQALAEAPEPLVVPAPGGDPQPLMARWSPALLPRLEDALDREEPLRRTVAALVPLLLDDGELTQFGDPARVFFNVNSHADLGVAQAMV